ncbi:MAG: hypothetical protein FWC47_05110 [Oscillospiraceae bacterium]|nr:hypothetical protein [Oscillospiraceae bacterium]
MNEIKIIFEQDLNNDNVIKIKLEDVPDEDLLFKFMISNKGIWTSLSDFSDEREVFWRVLEDGLYTVMMQAKHKGSKKPFSYISKREYSFRHISDLSSKIKDDEKIIDFNSVAPIFTQNDKPFEKNEAVSFMDENNSRFDSFGINNIMPNFQAVSNSNNKYENLKLNDNILPNINTNNQNNLVYDMDVRPFNSVSAVQNNDSNLNKDMRKLNDIKDEKVNATEVNTYDSKNKVLSITPSKESYLVGDKITIFCDGGNETKLYRFLLMSDKNTTMLRDYSSDNSLYHLIDKEGNFTIKAQIKDLSSSKVFDEEQEIGMNVKNIPKIDIVSFKCLNQERIINMPIMFEVKTNASPSRTVLYKFIKISEDGNQVTVQDFSTHSNITLIEDKSGTSKLLCLVKDVKLPNKFDDRAVIKYEVMQYKPVSIKSFEPDVASHQNVGIPVVLDSNVTGGKILKYRFLIEGPEKIDSGYINSSYFKWIPEEEGNYLVSLFVKDESFSGDYEDKQFFNYFIDPAIVRDIVIKEVFVENPKTALIGIPNRIEVYAEGSENIRYKFIVKKDDELLEMIDYNENNWVNFMPDEKGSYTIEIHAKDKYSKKPYDAMNSVDVKVFEYIPAKIDYLINFNEDNNLINKPVKINIITEDGRDTFVKYKILLDGHFLDETQYETINTITFTPKITGEYKLIVFCKNVRSKEEYDSKKIATIKVENALPVKNATIECLSSSMTVGEKLSFYVKSEDNYDTLYQFYLYENEAWKLIQDFSTNNNFSYVPASKGACKLIAICKNSLRIVNYDCVASCDYEIA